MSTKKEVAPEKQTVADLVSLEQERQKELRDDLDFQYKNSAIQTRAQVVDANVKTRKAAEDDAPLAPGEVAKTVVVKEETPADTQVQPKEVVAPVKEVTAPAKEVAPAKTEAKADGKKVEVKK